jgi:hypothetical protein
MRLQAQDSQPKVKPRQPGQQQGVWTGFIGFDPLLCGSESLMIEQVGDRKCREREESEREEKVEVQEKVRKVESERFCSENLGTGGRA